MKEDKTLARLEGNVKDARQDRDNKWEQYTNFPSVQGYWEYQTLMGELRRADEELKYYRETGRTMSTLVSK